MSHAEWEAVQSLLAQYLPGIGQPEWILDVCLVYCKETSYHPILSGAFIGDPG